MTEAFAGSWDYSNVPQGQIRDPSSDLAMQDEHGRWRVAIGGEKGNWLHTIYPSKALANLNIRQRQAIYDGDFDLLDQLDDESVELWKQR